MRLGTRGLGRTWPNPSVGCVLVKDGRILAAARTADGGRPHAETQALAQAGEAARGATAYVSLEPCAHYGHTAPCAQALIDAGIARVVIAAIDPDPRVSGQGMAMLEAAGIEVEARGQRPEASNDASLTPHRGFFTRIHENRPYVMMKLATSLDGHMADAQGNSQWITGEAARAHGHGLRHHADAVLTGIGTVLADDPQMTVRLPGLSHPRLVRIVADRTLRVPLDCQLVRTAETQPTWIITTPEAIEQSASHASDLRERGVTVIALEVPPPIGGRLGGGQIECKASPCGSPPPNLPPMGGGIHAILTALAEAGITRLLVEAGPTLSTAFLAAHAVDTLYWYRAPMLLGSAGHPAIAALDCTLRNAARLTHTSSQPLGNDRCDRWERAEME